MLKKIIDNSEPLVISMSSTNRHHGRYRYAITVSKFLSWEKSAGLSESMRNLMKQSYGEDWKETVSYYPEMQELDSFVIMEKQGGETAESIEARVLGKCKSLFPDDDFIFEGDIEEAFPKPEKINDASISQKKKDRRLVGNVLNGRKSNIKTFGIITAQNPNSTEATSSFNKKANKDLLKSLKDSGFIVMPVKGKFANNTEHSYIILNISLEQLLRYGYSYRQTSFIFAETGNPFTAYYYECEKPESIPDKLTNPYVKKDSIDRIEELDADDNYSLIGKNFKFTIPFHIFDSISNKIQDNVNLYYNGDGNIVDWSIKAVGYPAMRCRMTLNGFTDR